MQTQKLSVANPLASEGLLTRLAMMTNAKQRHWLRWLLGLLVLATISFAVLIYLASHVFFSPDTLVRKLERKRNCRASIGQVEISLFSQPASVIIHDLALAERDDFAKDRVPLSKRPPITDPRVSGKRFALSVSLMPLLFGKLNVRDFSAEGVKAVMDRPEDGDNSLEVLFDKPDKVAKKRSPGTIGSKEDENDEDHKTIDDLRFAPNLKSGRLEDCEFVLNLIDKQTTVRCHDVVVELTDFVADPSDLVGRNSAHVDLQGKVSFDHLERDLHYGDLNLRGVGTVIPYDRKTRQLEPELTFRIDVLDDSRIETMPLIDAIIDKVGDLERFGIRLDQFDINGDLTKEAVIAGVYKDKLFTLSETASLAFEDYHFIIHEDSWFNGDDNEHRFESDIVLTNSATERSLAGLGRFVEKKIRVMPAEGFRRLIDKHFVTDGRLGVQLVTKGDIGKPKVRFSNDLPDLDDLLKDAAEELLRDPDNLFKGLRSLFK